VWTLSWFDPVKEHLIGSEHFPQLSDLEVAQLLVVAAEDVLSGEFPMDELAVDAAAQDLRDFLKAWLNVRAPQASAQFVSKFAASFVCV
jgi:hypothetical protein